MTLAPSTERLPPVPGKRYFTIGEASRLCSVKPHVLRYWEQVFEQLHPAKRRGNRRYYRPADIATIRRIRALLYEQGFTVEGARRQLGGRPLAQSPLPTGQLLAELEAVAAVLRE